jgi:hypothetical protein
MFALAALGSTQNKSAKTLDIHFRFISPLYVAPAGDAQRGSARGRLGDRG